MSRTCQTGPSSSLYCLRGLVFPCLQLEFIFLSCLAYLSVCLYFFITIIFPCTIFLFVCEGLSGAQRIFFSAGFIVFRCAAVDPRGAPCRCESVLESEWETEKESVYVRMHSCDFECWLSRVCGCVGSPPTSRERRCAEVIIKGCCAKWRLKLKAVYWNACDYTGASPWGWPDGGTRHLFAPNLTAWLRGVLLY